MKKETLTIKAVVFYIYKGLLGIIGLTYSCFVFPQELIVEPLQPVLQADPRQVLSLAIQVINRTTASAEFIASIDLPAGWQLFSEPVPIMLEPNQPTIQLIHFMVPKAAPTGQYRLEYKLTHIQQSALSGVATINVLVSSQTGLIVKRIDAPDKVIAGKTYPIIFLVQNTGNAAVSLELHLSDNLGYSLVIPTQQITLLASESQQIEVEITTKATLRRPIKHRVQLQAKSPDAQLKESATSIVQIIPRITGEADNYHTLPTQLTFRYAEQKGENLGLYTELKVKGNLDEAKQHHLDILLRGPNIQNSVLFSGREEYRFIYENPDGTLHLGHHDYQLSPLTEIDHYGKGKAVMLERNSWRVGGFQLQDQSETKEIGLKTHYLFRKHYGLGLNYLNKQTDNNHHILSFIAYTEALKDLDATLEYAQNYTAPYKGAQAYYLNLRHFKNPFGYYLRLIGADPNFSGYYQDIYSQNFGFHYRLSKRFNIRSTYQHDEQSGDSPYSQSTARQVRQYQVGLDYRFPFGTQASLDWHEHERQTYDAMEVPQVNEQRRAFKLRLGQSFKKVSLSATSEIGKVQDRLSGHGNNLYAYTLTASFRPNHKQSYSIIGQYDKNAFINSSSDSLAFNSYYQFNQRSWFSFNLQQSHNNHQKQRYYRFIWVHQLMNSHQFKLTARRHYIPGITSVEDAILLEYSIPFLVPIKRRHNIATLNGRIYNVED